MQTSRRRLTNSKTIILGFFCIIMVGALLLMLPISTKSGQETTFLGALFTSVSATCVTGLVVYDTFTHWTTFGQLVLLILIQIGGLGFITISTSLMIALRRKIGLSRRALIQESLSTLQIRGSVMLVRRIGTESKLFLFSCCYALSFALNDFRRELLGYCVAKFDFICAVFVGKVFTAIQAMPILFISGFGNGCSLCGNFLKIMVRAVKLAVMLTAGIAMVINIMPFSLYKVNWVILGC